MRRALPRLCLLMFIIGVLAATPVMATGDVTYHDGDTISASVWAAKITIPSGAHVTYVGDVELHATNGIVINGRLQGNSGSSSGYDVLLDAISSSISITGSVVSAAGVAGTDATGTTTATGGNGGTGGDITLSWGALGSLAIADGAYIQTGAGGAGGKATVLADATTTGATSATGGQGGRGGNLALSGGAMVLSGTLRMGNGGRGGNASLTVPANSTGATSWSTTPGNAGNAGTPTLPAGNTILGLYNSGQLTGGEGGAGGSGSESVVVVASGGCGASGFRSGDPNSKHGSRGCDAGSQTRHGADGGSGVVGGAGGSFIVTGGSTGGRGGDGSDGFRHAVTCGDSVITGGDGGDGGTGESYTVYGGRGGTGVVLGGRGGDATASSGSGGNGGDGGDEGYTLFFGACDIMVANCEDFAAPICWLDVGLNYRCGHAGFGGSGGPPGNANAFAGSPGSSTTGLNQGSGTSSRSPGSWGGAGGNGWQSGIDSGCVHSSPHSHSDFA